MRTVEERESGATTGGVSALKSVNGYSESFAEDGPCAGLMTSYRVEVSFVSLAVRVLSVRVTE
jgi:hypothetical protein